MIPKKIHYCWFGNKPLPKNVKKCIKSWRKYCPDYEIIEWNESNFDINCNEFIKKAYEEKCWAFVSDYARLKIIYDNGGVYLDTDVELLKNIDILLNEDCYFAEQQVDKNIATGLGFGAKKGHKILKEMMDIYEKINFNKEIKDKLTCPILNTEVLEKYNYQYSDEILNIDEIKVKIYPPKYFDPVSPGKSKNLLCDSTISIHHYSASWTSGSQKLKRKIICMIGQERVNKIKEKIKS